MPNAYFELLEAAAGTARYLAGPATAGPWLPSQQHGGPPNALAVEVAAAAVAEATGRTDLIPLRLSAEFVGPVPVGEIETRVEVVRAARSAALASVVVSGAGRECLHARVWFVRDADTSAIATPPSVPLVVPDGPEGLGSDFGYGDSLEWRYVSGALKIPGPGAVWVRQRIPLLVDQATSDLARVVLIADSASGVSSELDWSEWTFLNVDLDVHLSRPVEGEWVLLDAVSHLGPRGSALARSTISDVHGEVGAGLQTLVLAPRRR